MYVDTVDYAYIALFTCSVRLIDHLGININKNFLLWHLNCMITLHCMEIRKQLLELVGFEEGSYHPKAPGNQ